MLDASRPYTTWLDVLALVVFAVLYGLYRTRSRDDGTYATDPVCGMQVYFCSEGCRDRFPGPRRFRPDPDRPLTGPPARSISYGIDDAVGHFGARAP